MNTHKNINVLLHKLFIFSPQEVRGVREKCKNASPEALTKLVRILEDALIKQEDILKRMIEADPEFPKKFNTFLHDQVTALASQREEAGDGTD